MHGKRNEYSGSFAHSLSLQKGTNMAASQQERNWASLGICTHRPPCSLGVSRLWLASASTLLTVMPRPLRFRLIPLSSLRGRGLCEPTSCPWSQHSTQMPTCLGPQGPQVSSTLGSANMSEVSLPPPLWPVLGWLHGFFSETLHTFNSLSFLFSG